MRIARVSITDTNLKNAAIRLLGQRLVSNEVLYIRKQLGVSATQQQLDESIVAVRKMPWAKIAILD